MIHKDKEEKGGDGEDLLVFPLLTTNKVKGWFGIIPMPLKSIGRLPIFTTGGEYIGKSKAAH